VEAVTRRELKLVAVTALVALVACAYDVPRTDSGRIDERQLKRDIDIDLTDKVRVDVEKQRILFECKVEKFYCI